MSKKIELRNIGNNGNNVDTAKYSHNADIVKGESIRIFGRYYGRAYDVTFKLGDIAEYDSYNLSYMGEISSITEKTVTIQPNYGRKTRRLTLETFINRNYDFDLQAKTSQNQQISYSL